MKPNKIKIIRAATVSESVGLFRDVMKEMRAKGYEMVALSSSGKDLETLSEMDKFRTIAVPMERHISIKKDIISLWKLIKVFCSEKPTMVHSVTPKAGMLCMLAAWITRVPVRVHTFTGLVFPTSTGLKRKILMLTDSITCACATHIIPEGEGVKSDLINNGITKKPMRVLGYGNVRGVDMEHFSRRPEIMMLSESIRDDSLFTFLFVGRIVRDKGINELCQAMDRLSGFVPARLILVGRYEETLDPISDESRDIIDKNPSIEYVGQKFGDELLAYYAAADCFVFPSYREGFPNTVLEAGAMGLPSIVTDINGSREIIRQDENGVIIPSKNVNALFDAMLNMVRDKAARERMAGNARRMVAERFEQGFVRQCLFDFYNEIL